MNDTNENCLKKRGRIKPASFFLKPFAQAAALVDADDGIVRLVMAAADESCVDVYLVGGVIRNLLLGRPLPSDYDFVVSGSVEAFASAVANRANGTAFILDTQAPSYRVVFKKTSRSFSVDFSPIKSLSGDIVEDLIGRDFTLNAMAVNLRSLIHKHLCEVIDPCGGVEDAKAGTLKAVSAEVFKVDPLRMLRAVRLSQQYGLVIDETTIRLIKTDAGLLAGVSVERIRDELIAIFDCKGTSASIKAIYDMGLMGAIIPQVKDWKASSRYDILAHTLMALDEADLLMANINEDTFGPYCKRVERHFSRAVGGVKRAAFFKLAAFLHDIGKPSTMTYDDGRLRFFGHDHEGSVLAMEALGRLRFSRRAYADISMLVRCHHRVFALADLINPSNRAKAHLLRSVGGNISVDLLCLALVDARATRGAEDTELLGVVRDMLRFYFDTYIKKMPQPIMTGAQVMKAFNLPEGPLVGEILKKIAEGVESGTVRTKKDAVAFVRKWLKTGSIRLSVKVKK